MEKLILRLLIKGINACVKKDTRAKEDYNKLADNISISMGIFEESPLVIFKKTQNGFKKVSKIEKDSLIIEFKNKKALKEVCFGKKSVSQSFAEHQLILSGDISEAMKLVRLINITEYYLFPRFITRKILPKMKKEKCSISIYNYILFRREKYE